MPFIIQHTQSKQHHCLHFSGLDSPYLGFSDNVLSIRKRIDRDGPDGHLALTGLTFRVLDSGNHESNITKNISILDLNDNAPHFRQHVYDVNVTENSTRGRNSIGILDSGRNGIGILAIDSGRNTRQVLHGLMKPMTIYCYRLLVISDIKSVECDMITLTSDNINVLCYIHVHIRR